MTTTTTGAPALVNGQFEKLEDGSWGVTFRVGGRAEECVGRWGSARRKDRTTTQVWLTEVVKDWGAGDVATFRIKN